MARFTISDKRRFKARFADGTGKRYASMEDFFLKEKKFGYSLKVAKQFGRYIIGYIFYKSSEVGVFEAVI